MIKPDGFLVTPDCAAFLNVERDGVVESSSSSGITMTSGSSLALRVGVEGFKGRL